jgi:DNA polymerase-3 subunit alpha
VELFRPDGVVPGFLAGVDRGRPRVDWRDLETFSEGVIALTGMPGGGGILSAAIEHSASPAEPIEAFGVVRRLTELYPGRLYLELAFHGNAAEKLVNRGLVAIAQRMELPLVATNAVRFARPDDALAHKVLEAIGRGATADGVLGHSGRNGYDLPSSATTGIHGAAESAAATRAVDRRRVWFER